MTTNIDAVLQQAVDAGASDVHLKVGSAPVIRVEGELKRLDGFERLTPADTKSYAEEILTPRAASDFKESGSADFAYGRHELGRFRVNAFRQRGSVSLVLRRVIPGTQTFAELGVPKIVEKLVNAKSGLVLVTGPSGSGKTTTMASMVDWINANKAAAIVTVEDPIEVLHPDKRSVVVQREVGVDTAHPSEAIRSAMRHDVDVVMISEIEDVDTARAAVSAAETGHLVISSMRTTDPADTVHRIVSLFQESEQKVIRAQLAGQMSAILSQRMIETVDGRRVLACEVMTNNERVSEWILNPNEPGSLVEIIKESGFFGMQTFDQSVLDLVVKRTVDLQAAIPNVRNVHEFRARANEAGIDLH
ncbi:MAG: PilT/PilU family type 4a pilus ATPase [Actinobacteria bacterium]|nr:MAG: PilT/PilU family type 4a pilus ATPase [Actinomycetota bacterium]REK33550.1 MAG: PilT/PilU family type 4a pilus ATPase [Actinomycetota bacterium]